MSDHDDTAAAGVTATEQDRARRDVRWTTRAQGRKDPREGRTRDSAREQTSARDGASPEGRRDSANERTAHVAGPAGSRRDPRETTPGPDGPGADPAHVVSVDAEISDPVAPPPPAEPGRATAAPATPAPAAEGDRAREGRKTGRAGAGRGTDRATGDRTADRATGDRSDGTGGARARTGSANGDSRSAGSRGHEGAGQSPAGGAWTLRPRGLEPSEVRNRWRDTQGGFVDDPRAAVQEAETLASEVADALVAEIEARRSTLRSAWSEGDGSDTEVLRVALRDYRSFVEELVGRSA